MQPCKRYFAALLSVGVTKIIVQQRHPDVVLRTIRNRWITMIGMEIGSKVEQLIRVERLIDNGGDDGDNVNSVEERKQLTDERRKRRKEQKQAKKHTKKERWSTLQTLHAHPNPLDFNNKKRHRYITIKDQKCNIQNIIYIITR